MIGRYVGLLIPLVQIIFNNKYIILNDIHLNSTYMQPINSTKQMYIVFYGFFLCSGCNRWRSDYLQSLIMMTAQWSDIKLW